MCNDFFEKLKKYKSIIIYGTGKRGKLVAEVLCRKYPELSFEVLLHPANAIIETKATQNNFLSFII